MSQALILEAPSSTGKSRTLLAGAIGNVLEWYDFAIYGYFAPVFAQNFFPSDDRIASLLAAFGVFAAAYMMRPLGSVVFGHIGDRFTRKRALTVSVVVMALSTFSMGLLPTHATLGAAAPVVLLVLRLLQGISVGGEFTTSIVLLVEQSAPGRRGFVGSWSCFGASSGILLGSAVGSIVNGLVKPDAVASWGWRIPFLLGIVLGMIALYLRMGLPDEPAAPALRVVRLPLVEAFVTEWRGIIRCFVINIGFGVSFYTVFIYLTTYLQQVDAIPASKALEINDVSMIVMLALIPLVGTMSDRLGRKRVLAASLVGLIVLAWPLFHLLGSGAMPSILIGQVGLAALVAGYS